MEEKGIKDDEFICDLSLFLKNKEDEWGAEVKMKSGI